MGVDRSASGRNEQKEGLPISRGKRRNCRQRPAPTLKSTDMQTNLASMVEFESGKIKKKNQYWLSHKDLAGHYGHFETVTH